MDFKKFIQDNHPDPDSVFGIDNYDFEQIVVLAQNFAKEEITKQLSIAVVGSCTENLAETIQALNNTLLANKTIGNYKHIERECISKLEILIGKIN